MAVIRTEWVDAQGNTWLRIDNRTGTVVETGLDYQDGQHVVPPGFTGQFMLVKVADPMAVVMEEPLTVLTQLIGSAAFFVFHTDKAAKVLTADFVSGDAIAASGYGYLTLLCAYIPGAAETTNSVVLKVELSDNGSDWYQETNDGATNQLKEYSFLMQTGAGQPDKFFIRIPVHGVEQLRVGAKESGVSSNYGTLLVKLVLGW